MTTTAHKRFYPRPFMCARAMMHDGNKPRPVRPGVHLKISALVLTSERQQSSAHFGAWGTGGLPVAVRPQFPALVTKARCVGRLRARSRSGQKARALRLAYGKSPRDTFDAWHRAGLHF